MTKFLIVYGDCQALSVAKALAKMPAIRGRFDIRHHHVADQVTARATWTDDLRKADIAVLQQIRQVEAYPVWWIADAKRPRLVNFAPVGFPSLWPFDTAFGGRDEQASRIYAGGGVNLNILDAQQSLLRPLGNGMKRLRAYAALQDAGLEGVRRFLRRRDPERVFEYDCWRLRQADARIETNIGRYITENFRRRRLFHTLGHPTVEVCSMIAVEIAYKLGLNPTMDYRPDDDNAYYQTPIHPMVAAALELEWVKASTL